MSRKVQSNKSSFYILEVSSPELEQLTHNLRNLCDGVEEYSFDERQIDLDLGKDAFVGAELNLDLVKKMESNRHQESYKFFFYGERAKDRLDTFMQELSNYRVDEAFMIEDIERDWNEEWRKEYKTIDLTDNWKIVPSWHKTEQDNAKNIFIYPGMGFGTGTHATTFNCLKLFIEKVRLSQAAKVLDFGCGSGILGVAVLKKDISAQVCFCDVDKLALDNCVQNLEINFEGENLSKVSVVSRERYKIEEFDLVFANILLNILLLEIDTICNSVKTKGQLILSGLTPEQEVEVLSHYTKKGFSLLDKTIDQGWLALRLKKA
jgi:ribosomal protein L11 methyltransferase